MNNQEFDFKNARMLRLKAEELLKEKKKLVEAEVHESDVKRLLHELQVHQIELEMQNEELQNAYDAAERALKKYTMLYEMAPMGYLTIKKDGTIRELNFTAAEMIGERRHGLVDANFKLFILEKSKPLFDTFLDKVFETKTIISCKIELGNENNHPTLVYMEGIAVDENNECLISFLNLSGIRKKQD